MAEDASAAQVPETEAQAEPIATAPSESTDKTQEQSADDDGGKPKRFTGKALRWNEGGFGFIKPDLQGEKDIFCHSSNIVDGKCLREGDSVEYEKGYDENHKKWRAENVTGGSDVAPGSVDQICFAWRDGHCSRGDSCKFAHKSQRGDNNNNRHADRGGGGGGYRERDYDRGGYDREYDRDYDRDYGGSSRYYGGGRYDRYERDRDYYRRDSYDRDRSRRDYYDDRRYGR